MIFSCFIVLGSSELCFKCIEHGLFQESNKDNFCFLECNRLNAIKRNSYEECGEQARAVFAYLYTRNSQFHGKNCREEPEEIIVNQNRLPAGRQFNSDLIPYVYKPEKVFLSFERHHRHAEVFTFVKRTG
jgi:hypothetical protein